ncbi:enoyl-CoA hydratase [Parafrankia discariae]|uniref:enoyl-CoA hydratase n=1 Tax=Parafrankia discariae TaxID=365528 RepID=UPI00035D0F26|nr:enoyl-CoA hydratase [Parafrankia discariae]
MHPDNATDSPALSSTGNANDSPTTNPAGGAGDSATRPEHVDHKAEHVDYEVVDEHIAVITLNRPQAANAQNATVLRELDEAWQAADADAEVRVIILRSTGKHFSAGHDMSGTESDVPRPAWTPDSGYDWETRHYLHYAKTWRDIPKPSIAAVQGKCIAGGLMLCWPCDLIVAADDAEFSDPVLHMGIGGVEYHGHTWELGARKAKELLFTGGPVTAAEALGLGMVNRVVPLDDLYPATLELARRIARQDPFALRMAKRAVNHTLDVQGFTTAVDSVFDMHHLAHARAALRNNGTPSLAGLTSMKNRGRSS